MSSEDDLRKKGRAIVNRALDELRALNVAECDHEGLRPDTRTGKVLNVLGPDGGYSIFWCTWCGAFRCPDGRSGWRRPGLRPPPRAS